MDFFDEELLKEEESPDIHDDDVKYKEQIIMLIDAQPNMLETCSLGDDAPEFAGLSWLAVAIKIAATMLRSKAIAGSRDEIAVIFYNTANSSTTRMGLEHIYVEQQLNAATISRIRSLQSIISSANQQQAFKQFINRIGIGSNDPDRRLRSLDSALWEATAMLPSSSSDGTSVIDGSLGQRIIICTRDEGPVTLPSEKAKTVISRAEIIAGKGGALQLLPFISTTNSGGGNTTTTTTTTTSMYSSRSTTVFDFDSFWIPLLKKAPLQADISYSGESGERQTEYIFNEEESIIPLKDLSTIVRMKAYKKRSLTHLLWNLTPLLSNTTTTTTNNNNDTTTDNNNNNNNNSQQLIISVKLYNTVHKAWPHAKGAPIMLHARDNAVLKSETNMVDAQYGLPVTKQEVTTCFYPKPTESSTITTTTTTTTTMMNTTVKNRFPRVFLSEQELKDLRYPMPKGLTLLGFRPSSWIKPWYQLQESSFIYPYNDATINTASISAFIALHNVMLTHHSVAICLFVRTPSAAPRLVAIVPQQEQVSEYDHIQSTPPGMNIIYLPYSDDIRHPECDEHFVGTPQQKPVVTDDHINAAVQLIDSLDLGDEFDTAYVKNPQLQRHFKVLESVAVGDDDGGGGSDQMSDDEDEDGGDDTVPDVDAFDVNIMKMFKDAICGDGNDFNTVIKSTAVKRKAPEKKATLRQLIGGADAEDYDIMIRIPAAARHGDLDSFTVVELKEYLGGIGLTKSGKKSVLIDRIQMYLMNNNN